jgi:hypothetical protein
MIFPAFKILCLPFPTLCPLLSCSTISASKVREFEGKKNSFLFLLSFIGRSGRDHPPSRNMKERCRRSGVYTPAEVSAGRYYYYYYIYIYILLLLLYSSSLISYPPALDLSCSSLRLARKIMHPCECLSKNNYFFVLLWTSIFKSWALVMCLRTARKKICCPYLFLCLSLSVCLSLPLSLSLFSFAALLSLGANTSNTHNDGFFLHIQHHQVVRIYNIYNNP